VIRQRLDGGRASRGGPHPPTNRTRPALTCESSRQFFAMSARCAFRGASPFGPCALRVRMVVDPVRPRTAITAMIESAVERNYWGPNEHGRVWGPVHTYSRPRKRLPRTADGKCGRGLHDGKKWHPGADFPELRSLLVQLAEIGGRPPRRPRRARASARRWSKASDGGTPGAPSAIFPRAGRRTRGNRAPDEDRRPSGEGSSRDREGPPAAPRPPPSEGRPGTAPPRRSSWWCPSRATLAELSRLLRL